MNIDSILQTQVAISLIPKLNSNLHLPLFEKCGGIEGFFRESSEPFNAICRTFNIHPEQINRTQALEDAKRELDEIHRHHINICTLEEQNYPHLLKQCEDVPLTLYYKGDIHISHEDKLLAVVGTRHSSTRFQDLVETVLSELMLMGHRPVIVSGLAYGIDAAAHRASLKNELRTFAVLGHGLHMIYPASHKRLAESILESEGLLISEFPCIAKTHPSNFLKRNRIIAGMCQATLVAESAIKGGAMSTARTALSYNRDVMAFPGRPDDPFSAGCNALIKENVAALVENSKDIARILGYPDRMVADHQLKLDLFGDSDKEEQILKLLLQNGDLHIDQLAQMSGITDGSLPALLLQLELENKILSLPGQKYTTKK